MSRTRPKPTAEVWLSVACGVLAALTIATVNTEQSMLGSMFWATVSGAAGGLTIMLWIDWLRLK